MVSYSETFYTNFKVLKIIGLWNFPTNNKFTQQLYYFYQSFSLFFFTSFAVLQYIDLYIVRNDVQKFSYNLCATASITIYILKTFRCLQKLPIIEKLRNDLDYDAENEKDEDCREIFNKAAAEMRFLNKGFYTLLYTLISLWALTPFGEFTSAEKKLPIRQWLPFDIQVSPNFEFAHFYQTVYGFFASSDIVTIDLITFGFMISLSVEYDVLNEKIKKFKVYYENSMKGYERVENKEVLELMKSFVVTHQKIISRIRIFEEVFNVTIMFQFVLSGILIAMIGNDMLSRSTVINSRFLAQLVYLVVVFNSLFVFCYYGTRVQEKSYELAHSAYDIPWVFLDKKACNSMSLMLSAAQEPELVTKGKLMSHNFRTFLDVVNMGYSFLTFLRGVGSSNK